MASVMVISVSLCLVAACPPSLLVPVMQDLEVSRLLFSSSFPSIPPSHTLHTPPPSLAPVYPSSRLSHPAAPQIQADMHADCREESKLPSADTPMLPNQVAPIEEVVPSLPNTHGAHRALQRKMGPLEATAADF